MRFPIFLTIYLVALLSVHAYATGWFLYYAFWWFDIVMHFAGGIWLGAVGYYILFSSPFSKKISFPSWFALAGVVMFACFVGVVWEIFEFAVDSFGIDYIGKDMHPKALLKDTLIDLFLDMAGAFVSSIIFYAILSRHRNNSLRGDSA